MWSSPPPLASVALENPPDREVQDALRSAFSINRYRTVHQDCAFGIRQLVDMALHALSPGINDTTTAVMCVDYLSAILARLAPRKIPSSHRYADGELRVISMSPTFASLVAGSFDEIRGSARGNVAILLRILDALLTIESLTEFSHRRLVLREQAERIAELGGRSLESPCDRDRFEKKMTRVREAFARSGD